MKKILFAFSTLFVLAAFTTVNEFSKTNITTAIKNGGVMLQADLTGAAEVTPGDPDGSGSVQLVLNQGQGTLDYMIVVSDIEPASAAHIHFAPAGSAGPVTVTLSAPTNGMSSGTILLDKETIKRIRKNPEAYYVNVHNSMYPGGALRGQLSK